MRKKNIFQPKIFNLLQKQNLSSRIQFQYHVLGVNLRELKNNKSQELLTRPLGNTKMLLIIFEHQICIRGSLII